MTLSNVPNTAMLTGTARTSVGARPRQNTRPPDSAYIFCAVRHDEPSPVSVAAAPSIVVVVVVVTIVAPPACKRVLRTSKGNVAIHPIIPAAAPATSGAAQEEGRESAWTTDGDGDGDGESGVGVVGEKRRSVPSYCLFCVRDNFFFFFFWGGGGLGAQGRGGECGEDACTHPVEV